MQKTIAILIVILSVSLQADPVPTTINDFFLPGSQPNESGNLEGPDRCDNCHGGYNVAVEPAFNWRGSMMAQAARDPIYYATMAVANQDAPESGDLCLRCHTPTGWIEGRSTPTDGSALTDEDRNGVQCDNCHKFIKPAQLGENPYPDDPIYTADTYPVDQAYLETIDSIPMWHADGMMIIDSGNDKRGPFADAEARHQMLYSPFHSDENFCGTCHDVSNPAFTNENGNYVPNEFDQMSPTSNPYMMVPVERTFSEWKMSEYKTSGVYAPQFGGNKDIVSTCQDCHLRDVTGVGCNKNGAPVRDDLPLHDMTGGNTFMQDLVEALYPDDVDPVALDSGMVRAERMLTMTATMSLSSAVQDTNHQLNVHLINETGHKMPSGYPEGRRIWINVQAYNTADILIYESCHYDSLTAVLDHDEDAKIYEIKPGISGQLSPIVNLPAGPSFHFVLNDTVYSDNRIPPRGFTNANFESIQSPPVGYSYSDGQYWDDTGYILPGATAKIVVTLYYQTTSKEYVEFLHNENTTNDWGNTFYDLWAANGKSYPVVMEKDSLFVDPVNENTSPVAMCLNITENANSNCVAYVSIDDGSYDPDGDPINLNQDPSGPYPLGQTTVWLVVTDDGGLADTCQGIITVVDATPPLLECPADITIDNDPGECGAIVSFDPTASDNCSTVDITATPPAGSLFPIGVTLVEVIAADSSGNADTCTFSVTVNDTEIPVVSCPADTSVQCLEFVAPQYTGYAQATDNCDDSVVVVYSDSQDSNTFTRTWVATDDYANSDSCIQIITVDDSMPPIVTCPDNITVDNDRGECGAVVTFEVSATDNCDSVIVVTTPVSGTQFPVGITTVTSIATDGGGNADTCTFLVTVNDIETPVVECPTDIAVDNDPGECGAIVSYDVTASDNCALASLVSSPESGSFFPVGTTPIEAIATDSSGNADTCSFNVTVNDSEPPQVVCQADTSLMAEPDINGAYVEFASEISDNCAVSQLNCVPEPGSFFPVGTAEVLCIGSDTSDNVDSCSFNITVYQPQTGYEYLPGDANMDGKNTGNDVTYLVNYFRSAPTSVPCYFDDGTGGLLWASADANGSCDITGNDVTKMVNFNRSDPTAPNLLYCPDYEPLYHTVGEVPVPLPEGWPFCENPIVTGTKIIPTSPTE